MQFDTETHKVFTRQDAAGKRLIVLKKLSEEVTQLSGRATEYIGSYTSVSHLPDEIRLGLTSEVKELFHNFLSRNEQGVYYEDKASTVGGVLG